MKAEEAAKKIRERQTKLAEDTQKALEYMEKFKV